MQDNSYRERWGISQSSIKDFQFKSPKKWKDIWIDKRIDLDKNEDNFTMGSLIDTLLFTPLELSQRFYVGEEKLPSKAIAWIVKRYYEQIISLNRQNAEMSKELPEEIPELTLDMTHIDMLLHSANSYCYKDGEEDKCGWNTGWKDETRIRNLVERGSDYFLSLRKAAGRKIISHEMNVEAINLVDILHSHSATKEFFVPDENNLLMFQLELFVDYETTNGKIIPLKGALDIARFNHVDRTVQIIDFKSSYSAFGFIHSIKQFGYCDQLSYYDFLLREWLRTNCEGKYCDYKMLPPLNVVIDISDRIPYIYEYDWRDIALAADGNKEFLFSLYQTHDHNARIKRGWRRILEEIIWHWENQLWDKPRELIETGRIKVNMLNS